MPGDRGEVDRGPGESTLLGFPFAEAGARLRPAAGGVAPCAVQRVPGCSSGGPSAAAAAAGWRVRRVSPLRGSAVAAPSAVASGGSAPMAVQIARWLGYPPCPASPNPVH